MNKAWFLVFFLVFLSVTVAAQTELDGDWAAVEDEREFRLGFFADRSKASIKPLTDGAIQVTSAESGSSIRVAPGDVGDASDLFGSSITNNYFANCGYVDKKHSKFAEDKVNFYYHEGGGAAGTKERAREELTECEAHRADTREKVVNFDKRNKYTLYFRPGTSVEDTREAYTLNTGSRKHEIVFTDQVGGIGHIGIRPDIGDEFVPDWGTGEEIRIMEGVYAKLGEGYYDENGDRYFSVEIYGSSQEKGAINKDLNYVRRIYKDSARQPEQLVIGGENRYVWIHETGDLMLDNKAIADIGDQCNKGAKIVETIGEESIIVNARCDDQRSWVNELELWKAPSDKKDAVILPEAKLSFDSNNYEVGSELTVNVDVENSGNYVLEVDGAGINDERTIRTSEKVKLTPDEEGKIRAKLSVDSEQWLLVDNSDLVDEASANIADTLPDASISYELPHTTADIVEGQKTQVKFKFKEPGEYRIISKINDKELINKKIDAESGQTYTQNLEAEEAGKIKSKVVAPSGLWVFGSDKTVASNNLEVNQAKKVIEAEEGEIHNITIRGEELIRYNDRTVRAHNTYRVASDDNPPTGVRFVWNDGSKALLRPNEGSSNIHLCEFGRTSEENYALVVTGDVEDPTRICRQESDNLEVDKSAEFGEVVKLQKNQIADFEGTEITLHGAYDHGITMNGMSYTLLETDSHSSTDNYIVTCRTNTEEDSAELTMIQERENPFRLCNIDVENKRNNEAPNYDMQDYSLEETISLSEGEGIRFGESTAYIDEIERLDEEYINVEAYKEWPDKQRDDLLIPVENSSTREWFMEGEVTIGTCQSSEEEVDIVMRNASKQFSDSAEWPEDWCTGETPKGKDEEKETKNKNKREISLEMSKEEFNTGEQVTIEASVTEKIAQKGYSLAIAGPEEHSKQFEKTQAKTSFNPTKPGEYTAKITSNGGLLRQVSDILTGKQEGVLRTVKFKVKNPAEIRWKQYCQQQDYNTEKVEHQIKCIKKQIIPNYFEDSTGTKPEIAQSLCQDLLGYQYQAEEHACGP